MAGIRNRDNIKIVTEAALVASILFHGFNQNLVILSDEAGQFNVFLHALCWIHAESWAFNFIIIYMIELQIKMIFYLYIVSCKSK